MINRCFGLGKSQSGEIRTIKAVRDFYQHAGVSEFFLHLALDSRPTGIRDLLKLAGMLQ